MRLRSFLLLPFVLAIPATALATGAPFATPPQPDVPVGPVDIDAPPSDRPPVAAPPLEIPRPEIPDHPDRPDLPVDVSQGPPDPLPSADAGIPNLIGVVDLPEGALDHVLDEAPPFGGEHGNARFTVAAVPEPTTALLLALGLVGLAARKR